MLSTLMVKKPIEINLAAIVFDAIKNTMLEQNSMWWYLKILLPFFNVWGRWNSNRRLSVLSWSCLNCSIPGIILNNQRLVMERQAVKLCSTVRFYPKYI